MNTVEQEKIETPRYHCNAVTGHVVWKDAFNRVIPGLPQAAFFANAPKEEGRNTWRRVARGNMLQYHVALANQNLSDYMEEADPAQVHKRNLERKVREMRTLLGAAFTAEMETAILAAPMPEAFTAPTE